MYILIAIGVAALYIWIHSALFFFLGGKIFYKIPLTKKIFHNFMGWHYPSDDVYYENGYDIKRCAICGKKIMCDSRGNWFTVGRGEDE